MDDIAPELDVLVKALAYRFGVEVVPRPMLGNINTSVVAKELNRLIGSRVVQALDLFVELRLEKCSNGVIGKSLESFLCGL